MKTIIEMAREASASMLHGGEYALFGNTAIERFAALVAATEREACAKLADLAEPYQAADLIRKRGQA